MATLKPSHLLCMLAFFCISSFVTAEGPQSDFFYLNLLWPGSYCNAAIWTQCCMPVTGEPEYDFFVESMETYNSSTGNAATKCNTTCAFYVNELSSFIADMYSYWPDVRCPSNNGAAMWESTFCKYGPCSSLDQKIYFQRALEIRKAHDLLSYLASEGIVPSKTARYDLEDIESALHANLSSSFVIECNRKKSLYQLLRIKICISGDGKNIITCPISKKTNCGTKVTFPPFTSDMLEDDATDMSNPIKMPFEMDQVV